MGLFFWVGVAAVVLLFGVGYLAAARELRQHVDGLRVEILAARDGVDVPALAGDLSALAQAARDHLERPRVVRVVYHQLPDGVINLTSPDPVEFVNVAQAEAAAHARLTPATVEQ